MTESAVSILKAFEALSPEDRRELTAEIVKRAVPEGDDLDRDLYFMTEELFQRYDRDEAEDGRP